MVEFAIEKELKYSILYLKLFWLVMEAKYFDTCVLFWSYQYTHILVTYSVRFRIVSVPI